MSQTSHENITRIQATMKQVAAIRKLPKHNRGDLEVDMDYESLSRFYGSKLVWILRTNGSVLVPAHLGVDPCYVTYWLWGNHGQEVITLIVDTLSGVVEKVTYEEAEKLIMEPPCHISTDLTAEALVKKIDAVLARGCKEQIWGIFNSPSSIQAIGSWHEWQRYFQQIGNQPMANLMGKALQYHALRLN